MLVAGVACGPTTVPATAPPEPTAASAPAPRAEVEPTPEPTTQVAVAPETAAAPPEACMPYVAALERTGGSLVVHAPPDPDERDMPGRLRTHVDGALSLQSRRVWVGPQVPGFMPLNEGTAELFLLEQEGDVFVGMYRDPYGGDSCNLGGPGNCDFLARAFDECGNALWSLRLNDFMSREDRLEVQDMRYVDGTLYFNEACQSYSSGANGRCSALVAIDPVEAKLLWRTKHLVSNNRFLVHHDYVIAGYGFTGEPDFLRIVRRSDGKVMHKVKLRTAHEDLRIDDDGLLQVATYDGHRVFSLRGFEGKSPRLVPEAGPSKRGRG